MSLPPGETTKLPSHVYAPSADANVVIGTAGENVLPLSVVLVNHIADGEQHCRSWYDTYSVPAGPPTSHGRSTTGAVVDSAVPSHDSPFVLWPMDRLPTHVSAVHMVPPASYATSQSPP